MEVDIESVINKLTHQVAQLSYDNAVLQTMVDQYREQDGDAE